MIQLKNTNKMYKKNARNHSNTGATNKYVTDVYVYALFDLEKKSTTIYITLERFLQTMCQV